MNYEQVSAKNFAEKVKLKGVVLTPRIVNNQLDGINITDEEGNSVLVEKRDYSFSVLVPKKPTVTKWRVTAKLPVVGIVTHDFNDINAASEARSKLQEMGAEESDYNEVEVEVASEQQ